MFSPDPCTHRHSRLRPRFSFLGRQWCAFRACGLAGIVLGGSLASFLAHRAGLHVSMIFVLLGAGLAACACLSMATALVTGRASLVYYRHEIVTFAAASVVLWLTRSPPLPYLDLTALGLGSIALSGRIGCFLVGCCHGRPSRFGVAYGDEHAHAGFPEVFVGVRLFPVQLVEAVAVTGIVGHAALGFARGSAPGAVFAEYVVAYGVVRFFSETWRGDAARFYWAGLSEAQWTSLAVLAAVVFGEAQGRLPHGLERGWHVAASTAIAAAAVVVVARRVGRPDLLLPAHVSELTDSLRAARAVRAPRVVRTSQGVGISFGHVPGHLDFVSMSRSSRPLTRGDAERLAGLLRHLASRRPSELVTGQNGVFHLLLPLHTEGGHPR
jgi:prolipoprotein diacylglyceryltransferase